MHRRPNLTEALKELTLLAEINEDAKQALEEYYKIKESGDEFLASRFVVEIIDLFYHYQKVNE